ERHHSAIRDLVPRGPVQDRLLAHLDATVAELRALYTGVYHLAELTARTLDAISGIGERPSYEIRAPGMDAEGIPAPGVDARGGTVTDDGFGGATPLMEDTAEAAARAVKPLVDDRIVPVLPGFIGRTRKGVATTLGRGGSDWSAAVIGAAMGAEEIQI